MRSVLVCSFILLFVWLHGQISFQAVCDARQVLVGETFQISFELENAQGQRFSAPDFSPFVVVGGPSRGMRTTVINGRMSSSESFTYELLAQKTGKFTIGKAAIFVQGQKWETKSLTIEVIKNNNKQKQEKAEVFVLASVNKNNIYEGQQCVLTYKIYTQIDIAGMEALTQPKLDGFQHEYINLRDEISREVYQGKSYTTKIISTIVLYPVLSGKINIPPVNYKINLRDNDPFSSFSMPSLFSNQSINIASNEIKIQVNELPKPIPNGFSGAVGNFTLVASKINQQYTLNDAIALSYTISGDGNFNTIEPKLSIGDDFEISDYKSGQTNKLQETPLLVKSKIFDYLIVPKKPGRFSITPGFIFYDPDSNRYKTLSDTFHFTVLSDGNRAVSENQSGGALKKNMRIYYKRDSIWSDPYTYALAVMPLLSLLLATYLNRMSVQKEKFGSTAISTTIDDPLLEFESWLLNFCNNRWNTTYTQVRQLKEHTQQSGLIDNQISAFIQEYEFLKFSGKADKESLEKIKHLIKSRNFN